MGRGRAGPGIALLGVRRPAAVEVGFDAGVRAPEVWCADLLPADAVPGAEPFQSAGRNRSSWMISSTGL